MTVTLFQGDCVQWAREYSGDPFHALLCDAPYEMEFMGKDWDGSGVAFDPETWKALSRPLHPGAFLFVFAGTINDDLISHAMRQAGLRKFHKMMGWVYGSGFPKASRLDQDHPKAEIFKGHRYGLQALKPAIETVLIFQKPYSGRPIDNITATGAGVLNVDGGRIGTSKDVPASESTRSGYHKGWSGGHSADTGFNPNVGRWPANFYLDAEAARRLDEQSGNLHGAGAARDAIRKADGVGLFGVPGGDGHRFGDSGGASRFFFRVEEQIDEADPVRYVAKASREERDLGLEVYPLKSYNEYRSIQEYSNNPPRRNPHPTVKPLALTRYLATLLLPPAEYAPRRLFVPFAGVASEMIGAFQAGWEDVAGVELTEEYVTIADARMEYWKNLGWQKPLFATP